MALPPPASDQAHFHVSALEGGIIQLPINTVIADAEPEIVLCPSLAFLLRHSKTDYQIVFDLGTRRDFEAYPPAMRNRLRELGFSSTVPQTVAESLEKGGIAPGEVDTVILSHLHWDHVGDHTPFTNAEFIVGEGCRELLRNGYPAHLEGYFSSTAVPADRTRFVSTSEMTTPIGPYPHALNLFGDGSLYIIDAPGHVVGHINVLARTSADSWILLAGDSAHDPRILTGEKAFACGVDAAGLERCIMHADKVIAEQNLERIRALPANVQVLIAHDARWYATNKGAFLPGAIPPLE